MQEVGCPVVVSDSHPAVLKFGKIVLTSRGGEGALREICDLIIKRRKE
jgi:N-acylneuraminate cytidylyltransferase